MRPARVLAALLLATSVAAAGAAGAAGAVPVERKPLLARLDRGFPAETTHVRDYVHTLADPRWEGRGIGTAGIDSAATWIAARMQAAGLAPAGDKGGWFQDFEVTTGVEVQDPCLLQLGTQRFASRQEVVPIGFSTNGTATTRLVFAGYGITAPGFAYDDYAGIDAHDAIVLVLTNEPGELDSTSRFDGSINTPYAEVRTKAINAREHGALGMLVVEGPQHHAGEPLKLPASDGVGYMTSGLLAANISQPVADALLATSGLTLQQAQAAIEADHQPHSRALPESVTVALALRRTRATTRNVIGSLAGRDSARTLVMGAHYDHLGYGGASSLSSEHAPHVGADDNASGTAAMLTAAERLAARVRKGWQPEHTLIFTAFSGEEIGLVGSSHFTEDPPRELATIEAMLNMDMVGRLRREQLQVMGVGTAVGFADLAHRVNAAVPQARFALRTSEDGYGPSDHSSFYKRDIPVLMLFTGAHPDYHKPSDTDDKINATGLARVSHYAQALVESLDARPRPSFTKAKADASPGRIAGGGGYGAYLGTIPDYMQTEGGVLLSGVRSAGPAEKGGLKGGDTIIRFDGIRVDNIYDYTFALRSRKPGQEVRITVKRAGRETDLMVTLGRRP